MFTLRWTHASAALVAALLTVTAPLPALAQAPMASSDVRQIVTFRFAAGRTGEAVAIYEQQLKPIYLDVPPLLRFRAYRETESPEPLDLVIVSNYSGMAGMDAANAMLRRPHSSGRSALALYGALSAMSETHHDQFVEMEPGWSDTLVAGERLTVFEYLRLAPGAQSEFGRLLRSTVRPYESALRLYEWSESGRMLVSDGWDIVRIFGIGSLGDWQRYRERMREAPFAGEFDRLISARKTIILRQDSSLSVR